MSPFALISFLNPINPQLHIDFIHEFGFESHIWTAYYKFLKELITCEFIVINLFSKNKKNRRCSASFHKW